MNAPCKNCGKDDKNKLFCPHCGTLTQNKVRAYVESLKVKEFWETGDPEVFSK